MTRARPPSVPRNLRLGRVEVEVVPPGAHRNGAEGFSRNRVGARLTSGPQHAGIWRYIQNHQRLTA